MATALKNIPFTTPAMAGETNYMGGTTYYLGFNDTIDADFTGGSGTLIGYASGCGWHFNGHATSANSALEIVEYVGGCSLSYSAIASKLLCITTGTGADNYFYGGLTDCIHALSFSEMYNKLSIISYDGGSSTIPFFQGGLQSSTHNGYITLDFLDGGCGYFTPIMRIGSLGYSLSVDANGFVTATQAPL